MKFKQFIRDAIRFFMVMTFFGGIFLMTAPSTVLAETLSTEKGELYKEAQACVCETVGETCHVEYNGDCNSGPTGTCKNEPEGLICTN